jgi:flagellar biosynthesis/type III secretory pathway protein FliH
MITRLTSIADYLGRQKRDVLRENRQEVVELILRISERVLRFEQSSQKDLLAANISMVLDDISSEEVVLIHLNPADFQAVRQHFARHDAPACRPHFSEDGAVPEGECRIRSKSMNIDVSFQKRFQSIRDRLIESLGEEGGH